MAAMQFWSHNCLLKMYYENGLFYVVKKKFFFMCWLFSFQSFKILEAFQKQLETVFFMSKLRKYMCNTNWLDIICIFNLGDKIKGKYCDKLLNFKINILKLFFVFITQPLNL